MSELERKIAEARRRYVDSLPAKAQAVAAAAAGGDRNALCTLAHRLAGSAGLHDLQSVQSTAAALDALCDAGATTDELHDAVAALVEALHQASREA